MSNRQFNGEPNAHFKRMSSRPGAIVQKGKTKTKHSTYFYMLWSLALALIMRVTIFVRPRSTELFSAVDTMALANIVIVAASFLFVLPTLAKRRYFQLLSSSSLKYLVLYYLICAVSGFWSENPYYSAYRALEMLSQIMLILAAVMYSGEFETAEKSVLMIGMLTILAGILMHLKLAGWSFSMGNLHTNSYSASAAILFAYCLLEWLNAEKHRRRYLLVFSVLSGIALVLGTSSASIIAALIGITVGSLLQKSRKRNLFLVIAAAVIILIPLGAFDIYWQEILFPGKTEEGIRTLTGRTTLWSVYYDLIEEKPIAGYGFLIVARMGQEFGSVNALSAHNGFFEVILGTGIIGGLFFLSWAMKLFKELLRARKRYSAGAIGTISACFVILANNMTIPIVGGGWNPISTVSLSLLALFVIFADIERRARQMNARPGFGK